MPISSMSLPVVIIYASVLPFLHHRLSIIFPSPLLFLPTGSLPNATPHFECSNTSSRANERQLDFKLTPEDTRMAQANKIVSRPRSMRHRPDMQTKANQRDPGTETRRNLNRGSLLWNEGWCILERVEARPNDERNTGGTQASRSPSLLPGHYAWWPCLHVDEEVAMRGQVYCISTRPRDCFYK